tara:strand:+ start:982 stop:3258 length:2277 start_codon:yes stop_codon:yes gene_type:complete
MGISIKDLDGAIDVSKGDVQEIEDQFEDDNPPVFSTKASVGENVQSLSTEVSGIPEQLYKAATGEDVLIEFPDVKESTEIEDVGFFESLIPNVKLMFARNDFGKAEIIADSFKGDKRFGGVFTDKYKNPMISWNGEKYYINKPGISKQDIGTLGGEILKYLPAGKLVSGAKTVTGKIATGIPAYTTTEIGGQAIEGALTPKTTFTDNRKYSDRIKDAANMGIIGTAIDVVTPPILKAPVQAVKGVTRGGAKILGKEVPEFAKKNIQTSKYNLTQGQRGTPPPDAKKGVVSSQTSPDIEAEDVVRNAPSTDPTAKGIVASFDNTQLTAIREDANALKKEFGSGRLNDVESELVPVTVAGEIKDIVSKEAESLRSEAGKGYKFVKEAMNPPIVTLAGTKNMVNKLQKIINDEFDGSFRSLDEMPILKKEITYIKNNLATIKTDQPFKKIAAYQKDLNRAQRNAPLGSQEALLLGKLKGEVDNFVFSGIESGFIEGNKNVIQTLKNSKDMYRQYIGISGKGTSGDIAEKSANGILKKLSSKGMEADAVVGAFFGHAKFNPSPVMATVLKRFKNNLPPEKFSEITSLVKDAVLEKAFAGKGNAGVTRTNIVNNYNEVFKKNKELINMLFSKQELNKISKFRNDVMPTLWAEIKLNPSNTGYTVLSAMARTGVLNYIKVLPLAKDAIETGQTISNINKAKDMVSQYLRRATQPLFIESELQSISAPAREELIGTEEIDTSAINQLVESISGKNIDKILSSIRK